MGARGMKIPPFDASRHGDSDDMCFKFMRSLDGEILQFKSQFLELSGYFWQVSVYHIFCHRNKGQMESPKVRKKDEY